MNIFRKCSQKFRGYFCCLNEILYKVCSKRIKNLISAGNSLYMTVLYYIFITGEK